MHGAFSVGSDTDDKHCDIETLAVAWLHGEHLTEARCAIHTLPGKLYFNKYDD